MASLRQVIKGCRNWKFHWRRSAKLLKAPQKQGVVYKLAIVSPKKPNSAKRKIAKVKLSTGKKAFVHIPGGTDHNIQNYMRILVRGGKRRDTVGCHYTVIRSSKSNWKWHVGPCTEREKRRSKFGVCQKHKRPDIHELI